MKISNKILLIAFGIILLLSAIIIIGLVFFLNNSQLIKIEKNPINIKNKEYNLNNFNSLILEGSLTVKIDRSNTYDVSIIGPEEIIKHTNIIVQNNRLEIKQEYLSKVNPQDLELIIKMPNLTGIISKGINNISFSGFKEENLVIESIGFNKITGKKSTIKNLSLTSVQVNTDFDFSSCVVENVKLNLCGFGTTYLQIAGGKLEGRINGSAIVNCNNNIKEINVEILGEAKLNKNYFVN